MDNFNINKNTMDKLNYMIKNGNLNEMLSKIPPDTMKNLSNMLNNNSSETKSDSGQNGENQNNSNTNNFDFNNIDINTLMKMKTIMEKMNNSSSGNNLLQSLKPYLRDEKKQKLDQYSQILNMTSLIELFNQNNNNNNKENGSV